jgi:hypothetical protein
MHSSRSTEAVRENDGQLEKLSSGRTVEQARMRVDLPGSPGILAG